MVQQAHIRGMKCCVYIFFNTALSLMASDIQVLAQMNKTTANIVDQQNYHDLLINVCIFLSGGKAMKVLWLCITYQHTAVGTGKHLKPAMALI